MKQPYCSNNESDEKMNLLVERLNNTNYKLRTENESLKSTILDKDENIKKFICDIRVISDMLKANKTAPQKMIKRLTSALVNTSSKTIYFTRSESLLTLAKSSKCRGSRMFIGTYTADSILPEGWTANL